MMTKSRSFLAALFLLAPAQVLPALEGLDTLSPLLGSGISIPPSSHSRTWYHDDSGAWATLDTVNSRAEENGLILLESRSGESRTLFRFDASGHLLGYDSQTPDLPARSGRSGTGGPFGGGGDRISTVMQQVSPGSWQQVVVKKDGTREVKDFRLAGKDALFLQLPYLVQKAVRIPGLDGFNADGVMGAGMKVNFDVRILRNTDPFRASPRLSWPPEARRALGECRIDTVAVLTLTGIPGLIYPHPMYFGFGPAPQRYVRAFWGGEPGKEFCQAETGVPSE